MNIRTLTIAALLTLALSACGIKPGGVDSPTGEPDTFPRTYPNIETDPQ